jgi:hypothetical protein
MAMRNLFTDHPASVDESYTEHMRVAGSFAGSLAIAAGAALVHAVVPCLCEKTASRRIAALNHRMTSGARGRVASTAATQPAA